MSTLLIIAMMPMWLLGLVVFFYLFKPIDQKIQDNTGFDVSNRINRFRALWFVLTRPWGLVGHWPWLKNDEGDS
jgi:hypothetical protein